MSVTAVPLRPIKKGSVAKLWIGLAILLALAIGLAWWGTAAFQTRTLPSGVTIRALRQGSGARITPNDVAALHYRLHVGSKDSPPIQDSREMGQPLITTTQSVYPGFGEGLQQMRPGGSYILTLPPGSHEQAARPGLPFKPTDKLVFEVDVLQVQPGAAQRYMQMQQLEQLQRLQQMQQMQQQGGKGGRGGGAAGAQAQPAAPPAEGAAPTE